MSQIDGVFKELGLDSLIRLAEDFYKGFKLIFSMIDKLAKLLSLLLSPIADVIMAILYPILLIIKPIAIMVKQIMKPFMQIMVEANRSAMTKKAEGDVAGMFKDMAVGLNVVFVGFGMVLYGIFSKSVELFFNFIFAILQPILSFFKVDIYFIKIFNSVKSTFDDVAINSAVEITKDLTKSLKSDNVPALVENLKGSLEDVFKPSEVIKKALEEQKTNETVVDNIKSSLELSNEVLINQKTNILETKTKDKFSGLFTDARTQILRILEQLKKG